MDNELFDKDDLTSADPERPGDITQESPKKSGNSAGNEEREAACGDPVDKTECGEEGSGPEPDAKPLTPAGVSAGKLRIILLSVTVLTALAALLRSLSVLFFFDADPGYFRQGFLPVLSVVLTGVTFMVILSLFIVVPKGLPDKKPGGSFGYFISTFAAFVMAFEAGYRIWRLFDTGFGTVFGKIFARGDASFVTRADRISAVLSLLLPIASAGAAALFFLRSSPGEKGKPSEKMRSARLILGIFPALRAIFGFASLYFDMSTVMNGDMKLLSEFALIFLMLFFLTENRMELGGERSTPRAYLAGALAAFLLSFTTGISAAVGFFAGKIGGEMMIEALFLLVCGLYARMRAADYSAFVGRIAAKTDVPGEGEKQ